MQCIYQEIRVVNKNNKRKRKTWTRCPSCGHDDLLVMGADFLCLGCDWSNAKMLIDEGRMDSVESAFKEHFNPRVQARIQRASEKPVTNIVSTPKAS